ncbi:hypothetical protein I350_04256 [Cryptococcus amylolentus CBS 6273]|uniref:SAGA-associated factor 11 n=1 Tax=Cryptococcus amylolentus CBS 6273 TaxID=1296118 RepID=A0A1E3K1I9_9TREE|nr:hypothetical protein I350_04256 [Cryptococcus amylolentus CBS 6273]
MSLKDEIRAVASSMFDEMLDDLILTTAISAHREIKRGRAICGTCGTKCRSHVPVLPSNLASSSSSVQASRAEGSGSSSRAQTPQLASEPGGRTGGYAVGPEKGTGGATGIGSGSGRMDSNGNAFFDCLVCSRPIASNRYAPHLAKCLNLGGSTRRVAARSAAVKARLGTGHDRSSPSPYLGSDGGEWTSDADSTSSKKKSGTYDSSAMDNTDWIRAETANGTGKRNISPTKPAPKTKKAKLASAPTTPASTPQFPRQALPPSKLGRPPTNRQPTFNSSPVSSPEKSVISVASSSTGGGGGGGGGGMTGLKTLPGVRNDDSEFLPAAAAGDDSSEAADDDY